MRIRFSSSPGLMPPGSRHSRFFECLDERVLEVCGHEYVLRGQADLRGMFPSEEA